MNKKRHPLPTLLIVAILLSSFVVLGRVPATLIASPRLPHVTPEMERPEFWIKKIKNPKNLLLAPEKIQKMNEENLKRKDLLLCRISNLKEDWRREEILILLKEDWKNFGRTGEVRYGKSGIPLGEPFWNELKTNLNEGSVKESSRMLLGLIVKRSDIRVFPTDEPSMSTPDRYEFDRFQHSSISPGSAIGIYHFSKDQQWAYAQTPFIRGWVRVRDLAIAKERSEVADYEEAKDRLLVTGNLVHISGDPFLRQTLFPAQMGDSFPLVRLPNGNQTTNASYVIQIPSREETGHLTFRKGYFHSKEDVQRGFLPFTQENVARQAFKMLNHPYGWGDRLGGRDCSRFIMDLFRTFGILMPRNSKEQATVGMDHGMVEGKTEKEKRKVLDRATPLATTLRLPGHIMLYLGKDHGRHYVMHSIWGIERSGPSHPEVEKIGRAVISDLSLGRSGPNGSLLARLTDIRLIGAENQLASSLFPASFK
jgi:hypothetical protein